MRRHLVPLATFLVQTDPPALALRVVVLDPYGEGIAAVSAPATVYCASVSPNVRLNDCASDARFHLR
jgi:hypothetical protein